MTSVIDRNAFEDLKQMAGADFIDELIDTFLEDAPQLMIQLQAALASNDAESFRRAAHSLKSNAASFGANHLSGLAKELETLGRENKLTEVGGRLRALEEAYQTAARELKGMA
ncbi:MAG TPA: Hpt domain-containing protein [Anaerolineales bacterium]|nr:Hpt domain-containing protein [Anaerolineales bacterium]